jgi:hypothetical protein
MWDTRKIDIAYIVDRRGPVDAEFGWTRTGDRTIVALLETGEEIDLFCYDSTEMSFDVGEFSGLTVSVARRLRHDRDLAQVES